MNNTKIQVPVSQDVRERSESKARNEGFSSLQDVVRLFLHQYASNKIKFNFINEAEPEQLEKDFENKVLTIIKNNKYLPSIKGTDFINQLKTKYERTGPVKKVQKTIGKTGFKSTRKKKKNI